MGILNKAALALGTAAILTVSAAPAEARGWGGYGHRHHDRVDAGDVLTGIGILAGIAIIADAATKSSRNDRAPEPRSYPEDDGYDYQSDQQARSGNNDVGSAVQACSSEAERRANAEVTGIDSVERDGEGWRVQGKLNGNEGFTCGATNGQVDFVQLDNDY